jgi:hypothetical protein
MLYIFQYENRVIRCFDKFKDFYIIDNVQKLTDDPQVSIFSALSNYN